MIVFGFYSSDAKLHNKVESIALSKNIQLSKVRRNNEFSLFIGDINDNKAVNNFQIFESNNVVMVGRNIFCKNGDVETFINLNANLHDLEKCIVNNLYGSYLLFNLLNDTLKITRDPIGQLPLFYTKIDERTVCFSTEIYLFEDLFTQSLCYDDNYISSYLLHTLVTSGNTAFENINELPHGCTLSLISKRNRCLSQISVNWDPRNLCTIDREYSGYQDLRIAEELETVLRNEIGDGDIMLDFSGGLDSSALLLMMNHIIKDPQKIHAINFFHPKVATSDERKFAKKLTDIFGNNFIEFDYDTHPTLRPITGINLKPNWPEASLNSLILEYEIVAKAKKLGVKSYFSGEGGDHIFLSIPPMQSIYDYYYCHGMKGIKKYINEIAVLDRTPLLKILRVNLKAFIQHKFALKYKRDGASYDDAPWIDTKKLLKRSNNISSHPFFDLDMTGVLPGKFQQLDDVFAGISAVKFSVREQNNPMKYPLLSQPIIELSLKMPTFVSFKSGYDRYPFREAITKKFGSFDNIWRVDKGETTAIDQLSMRKSSDYIISLCLEGRCMSSGFIEKKHKDILYNSLLDMMGGKPDLLWPILNLISLEMFFELWNK